VKQKGVGEGGGGGGRLAGYFDQGEPKRGEAGINISNTAILVREEQSVERSCTRGRKKRKGRGIEMEPGIALKGARGLEDSRTEFQ